MKKKFYLIFVLVLSVQLMKAQTYPGGVSTNLKLWIKSDQGTSNTGGLLDSWQYANSAFSFTSTGSDRPSLLANKLNFKPSVNFAGANMMNGPTGADAPITLDNDEYTVFAVWQTSVNSANQSIWTQGKTGNVSGDYFSFYTLNGKYGSAFEEPPTAQTIQGVYTVNTWNISQMRLLNSATSDFILTDNKNISTGPLILGSDVLNEDGAGLRSIKDELNRLGNSGGPTDAPFDGDIAELIVYDGPLADDETQKVFTYLAVKYGITLKTELISSSTASTVWDASQDAGKYNNGIFGLALDIGADLDVRKSNSIETGNGDGTGQSGKANIVISNPSALTDDETYLLIGNDNFSTAEVTTSTDLPPTGVGSSRLGREWKVQLRNSKNLGTVSLTFDLTDITVSGHVKEDFRLMVTDDPTGDFTSANARTYKAAIYNADTVRFNNVTLNNNEVFSLITFAAGALPVTWKSFTGSVISGGIALNWVVDNNEEGKTYEIEHSSDGKNFAKTGEVLNQKNVQSYKFNYNTTASGIHYFRIHQIDMNGQAYYSKVVKVLIKGNSAYTVRLLNNPVINNYAEFEIVASKRGKASIELLSFAGAKIANKQVSVNQGTNRIKIPMDRAATGTYLLKLQIDDVLVTEKVMKF